MVKFLEDELKASETRHCDTCKCPNRDMTVLAIIPKTYTVGTQTVLPGDTNSLLCLRCNSNLNSPSRTNSPFTMKLVKSSDSVISETKSSVSDSTQNDKLFTPAKKEEIMVNPILGHHRLCDRTTKISSGSLLSAGTSPKQIIDSGVAGTVNSSSSDIVSKTALAHTTTAPIFSTPSSTSAAATVFKSKENQNTLLLFNSDTNDTDNEEIANEKTSLLGNNVILSPKSKSNNIASKLLLKSPELMGGAKPRTPELKTAVASKSSDTVSQNRAEFEVEKGVCKTESLRGPGNGSTTSLWSRTSSKDGSKIFENFNRNLIKTIKVSCCQLFQQLFVLSPFTFLAG